MRIRFTYLFVFITVLQLSAQQGWTTLTRDQYTVKMKPVYEKMTKVSGYSMKILIASYAGAESNTVYDQEEGFVVKSKNKFFNFTAGIRTIQDGRTRLAYDSVRKIITVNDISDSPIDQSTIDTASLRAYVNKISYSQSMGELYFKLEFKPGYRLNSVEMKVKDNWIVQTILNYAYEVKNPTDGKKVKPKVVITYSDIKLNPKVDDAIFSLSRFIVYEDKKKITVTRAFKDFKFYDQRVKPFLK